LLDPSPLEVMIRKNTPSRPRNEGVSFLINAGWVGQRGGYCEAAGTPGGRAGRT
jgi:hypothetical protein